MTDIFDERERAEFATLGLDITDTTISAATASGTMQVELKKWGPHHFHLRVVLPSGVEVTAFTPRTKIVPPICEDLGES